MQMKNEIVFISKLREYKILFLSAIENLAEVINQPEAFLIIDKKVYDLYRERLNIELPSERIVLVDVHEEIKNLEYAMSLYKSVMEISARKNIHLVSIGGGIIQDLSGFIASTLYRGVNWTYVPTTLLSLADSCVGGKTSLNFESYKNLIGTFYPPSQILVNAEFTQTLSDLDYFSGLGEVVKLHLNGGTETTNFLVRELLDGILSRDVDSINQSILSCLKIKKAFIEEDEFDQGKRNLLNYGHCFGHAVETASRYAIPHGQAVVIGMIMANYVSCQRGSLGSDKEEELRNNLLMPILKVDASIRFNSDELIRAMKNDKKRVGAGLPLIILQDDATLIKLDNVVENEVLQAISYYQELVHASPIH